MFPRAFVHPIVAASVIVSSPLAWAENYQVNQKVEVEENGTWYPSVILKVDGQRYFIHYEGYDTSYDTWVGPERVRALKAPTEVNSNNLKVGDVVEVWHNGNGQWAWMRGEILSIKGKDFEIWYGGSRYNVKVFGPESIKGTKEQKAAAEEAKIDVFTREAFAIFEAAVANAESVVASGATVPEQRKAIEATDTALTVNSGKAKSHPQVTPVLARYWTLKLKELEFKVADARESIANAISYKDINFARNPQSVLQLPTELAEAFKAFRGSPDADTARVDQLIEALRSEVKAASETIEIAYLEDARLPKEIYNGADKAKIKALLTKSWNEANPDKPILKIIAGKDWSREKYWEESGNKAYWKVKSRLTMLIVSKKNDQIATCYPVGVVYEGNNKNNLEVYTHPAGFMTYVPFDVLLKHVN